MFFSVIQTLKKQLAENIVIKNKNKILSVDKTAATTMKLCILNYDRNRNNMLENSFFKKIY